MDELVSDIDFAGFVVSPEPLVSKRFLLSWCK
jgi:hypothetical protein